jgi:hypothetical protein
MSFPPCERLWLVRDEETWKEIWLADREYPKGYLELFMTTTQRPGKELKPTVIVETLWFYRHVRDVIWKQLWCSGESRPCRILIDVEEEYDTLTTREIAFNMPKVKYILYFVRRINHGDPSRSQWCKEWAPEGYIPDGIGTTCYKTTTEELR